jgi:SAM-dependent methyltransferase
MFVKSARFYDALYEFKDYAAACDRLHEVIQGTRPGAASLLDVACGTGRHLEHLRRLYDVEGMDLNPELLAIARERCPGVPLHQADMQDARLDRTFDVVTCLFSSIGYLRTTQALTAAVANMARHLNPGGILVIEPWFSPDRFWVGRLTANYVDRPDLKIAWMYTSEIRDGLSVMDIHYLVGTPAGVEYFTERHELGLFTDEEYREAVTGAGLMVDYDPDGLFGRGMYIGVAPGGPELRGGSSHRAPRPGEDVR